jgi:hypothetical protein
MTSFNSPVRAGVSGFDAWGWVTVEQHATLAYTDTVAKNLFLLPQPYQIIEIYTDVTTLFNSSGTDLVTIGIVGTANKFATALDVSTAGRKLASASGTTQLTNFKNLTAVGDPVQIIGTYTQSVADATTGAANITIVYSVPILLNP